MDEIDLLDENGEYRPKPGRPFREKPPIRYSERLIDKIAEELASDIDATFEDVAKEPWAPTANTMRRWRLQYPYAREKFSLAVREELEEKTIERIMELARSNLKKLARDVDAMEIAPSLKVSLFNAEVSQIWKRVDLLYKKLEYELPKKYAKRFANDLSIISEVGNKDRAQLEKEASSIVKMLAKRGILTNGSS